MLCVASRGALGRPENGLSRFARANSLVRTTEFVRTRFAYVLHTFNDPAKYAYLELKFAVY